MQRPSTIKFRESLLRDAIALMEAEYATELQLDDVARRIATSRRQLQRSFEEHHGMSYRECLTRIRMTRAAEMLATTGLTVREIGYRVGYRQPAQFAKAFNRVHGTPPSRFRAERRTDAPVALAA